MSNFRYLNFSLWDSLSQNFEAVIESPKFDWLNSSYTPNDSKSIYDFMPQNYDLVHQNYEILVM